MGRNTEVKINLEEGFCFKKSSMLNVSLALEVSRQTLAPKEEHSPHEILVRPVDAKEMMYLKLVFDKSRNAWDYHQQGLRMVSFFTSEIGKKIFEQRGAAHIYPTFSDVVDHDPHRLLRVFNRGARVAKHIQAAGTVFAGHLLPQTGGEVKAKLAEAKAAFDAAQKQWNDAQLQVSFRQVILKASQERQAKLNQSITEKTKAAAAAQGTVEKAKEKQGFWKDEFLRLTNPKEAAAQDKERLEVLKKEREQATAALKEMDEKIASVNGKIADKLIKARDLAQNQIPPFR